MSTSDIAREREEKLAQLQQAGEEAAIQRMAQQQGIPYANITENPRILNHEAMVLVTKDVAERARIVPLSMQHTSIRVGVVDPHNEETRSALRQLEQRGYTTTPVLISLASLQRGLEEYAHVTPPQEKEPSGVLTITKEGSHSLETLREKLAKEAPLDTTKLLALLADAGLALNASDIHIEPTEAGARLRLRLDGVLEDIGSISQETYKHLVSRLKVLASIPLNVTTRAHDGRFTIARPTQEAEVRLSILPSPEGEYVVLRLLNPNAVALEVDDLGIEEDIWEPLKKTLTNPNGIILTTGPTGSGKTTTLYAFLKYLNNPDVKIITLENPIEYHLDGISQTQIDTKDEYGFAKGVRAALRHDPDIMLVGEIRDQETADAALNASLTGHLVFSTLHTNDAVGAIPRFLDLNAKASILSSALRTVIAQRLVRRLCDECRIQLEGDEYTKTLQEITEAFEHYPSLPAPKEDAPLYKAGSGCDKCSGTGYRGRTGIFEVLMMTDDLERLVASSPSHRDVLDHALSHGFQTMYVNGLRKVVRGITSLEEVRRIAPAIVAKTHTPE